MDRFVYVYAKAAKSREDDDDTRFMKKLRQLLVEFKTKKATEEEERVKAYQLQEAKLRKHQATLDVRNSYVNEEAGTSNDAKGEKKRKEIEKVSLITT